MPITNGSVSYERRVKTGDFEYKHAAVTVHYALDEGGSIQDADDLIALAGSLTTQHVYALLRRKPTAAAADPAPAAELRTDGPVAPSVEPVVEPVVAEPTVVAEVIPPVTNLKAAKRAVKAKEPVIILDQDAGNGATAEVSEEFTADAPAATDAELGQALSRVNTKLKDRPRIQALIGEFVQSGQSYTMIPTVRRGEFISRLEALA